jgi:hypothetical protein
MSVATDIDICLYSLLQHIKMATCTVCCSTYRWLPVQSAAAHKLFFCYRMKPSEYLYLHQQINLQLTCIFCKSLILMLLNLLRRICCCFLVMSCPLVCFTKPALVISSSMHFYTIIKEKLTLFTIYCHVLHSTEYLSFSNYGMLLHLASSVMIV